MNSDPQGLLSWVGGSPLLARLPELCLSLHSELPADPVKALLQALAARCTRLTTLRVVGLQDVDELLQFKGLETLVLENLVFQASFIKALSDGALSSLKLLDIDGAFVSYTVKKILVTYVKALENFSPIQS